MKISSMDEVYGYIYSFINTEKNEKVLSKNKEIYSLYNIKNCLKYFGNIHNNFKIIHIAGTKGKGSVALFITYLLKLLGKNVTTFLSPHLIDINERFLFNLDKISNDDLISLTNEVKIVIDKNQIVPTTFELLFIIFLLFSKKVNAEYIVLETGLGGRLDCTNVVNPALSVITPISIDHTNILGKTIKKIAREKAGIIKNNISVVLSKQTFIAKSILYRNAKINNSKIFDVNKYIKLKSYTIKNNGIQFCFKFLDREITDIFIPLLGFHQINNFFQSLLAVYFLCPEIIDIVNHDKYINIKNDGRLQIVNKDLPIIIDVAHNRDSAKKLKEALLLHYPKVKWTILSGMAIDKDYDGFFKELKQIGEQVIVTGIPKYKQSNPDMVFKSSLKYNKNSKLIYSFEDALKYTFSLKKPLLVTGSFYIAGPFLEKVLMLQKDMDKRL